MKSCYKSLKQLDSQGELYSSLIFGEYFLLKLKISPQTLEKFLLEDYKGLS